MFDPRPADPDDTGTTAGHGDAQGAMLEAEIGFWQELIDDCGATHPTESLERMQQALALAECRLACLSSGSYPADDRAGPDRTNVFDLERARRLKQ